MREAAWNPNVRKEKSNSDTELLRDISPVEKLEALPQLSRSPKLEKFIEQIDWKILQDIFNEIAAPADLAQNQVSLVPPERIFIFEDPNKPQDVGASYRQSEHIILFKKNAAGETILDGTGAEFSEPLKALDGTTLGEMKSEVSIEARDEIRKLIILIHEQCHAFGFTMTEKKLGWSGPTKNITSGYRRSSESIFSKSTRGLILNEGTTQLLTFYVLREYTKRMGGLEVATTTDVKSYEALLRNHHVEERSTYALEMRLVDLLIEVFAENSDVPTEKVRLGLFQGYLHGGNLYSKEFKDQLPAHIQPLYELIRTYDNHKKGSIAKRSDRSTYDKITKGLYNSLSEAGQKSISERLNDYTGMYIETTNTDGTLEKVSGQDFMEKHEDQISTFVDK